MTLHAQLAQAGRRVEDIARITIRTHAAALRIIDKKGPLANPADRDHCIQYMVAVPLIFGRLRAADYEDEVARDARIDSLRAKIECIEDAGFTRDYHAPGKRSIANALTVEFNDGTKFDEVVIEYPIGHKRRRHPVADRQVPHESCAALRRQAAQRHCRRLARPGPPRGDARQRGNTMAHNLHKTLKEFDSGSGKGKYYSLPQLGKALGIKIERLPVSIRIVLESVLRNYDGKKISEKHVEQLAKWQPNAARTAEIPFVVSRVVLQDFTGVPLLADIAAMRGVARRAGRNPKLIEPLVPVDLVVDHSVQIDYFRQKDALELNMKLEFERNKERYQFMKWGMQAFDTFKVVPPGVGIVHQVNLEYLARGVHKKSVGSDTIYYPDTLVGTDSHTTMINGIGVVGWGVGGIEAEAGMLGQPVYFLTPDVVGVQLKGKLREGVTATDLVLTITEMLRKEK
ncbi:hypothetical protein DFQ30_004264, partial [Apophysomyces sp. BC1015]